MVRRRDVVATLGSGADLALRQGVQFVVLLVLARLLPPEDFGTIALLALVVSLTVVVADLGLTTALLQSRDLSTEDVSTAFWIAASSGTALTAVAASVAVPIATTLDRPELGGVASVMSVTILLTSLGAVPSAMLIKRQQFGRLAVIGAIGGVGAGGTAIAVAVADHGVWALAVLSIGLAAATSAGVWVAGPVHVTLAWNRGSADRLLRQGKFVLAANLCDAAYTRTQVLLVGAVAGPAVLGHYLRADSTQQLPADAAAAVVGRVALPVFAESSGDRPALRTGLRTAVRSSMAVNAIAMALLGGLAVPLVQVMFGSRWAPAAPILTVLCLSGLFWPLHVMNINILYAMGRARQVFHIDLLKKSFGIVALGLGAYWGVTGVAWAQAATGLFAVVINGRAVGRVIGFGVADQVRCVARVVAVALAVGAVVWTMSRLWHAPAGVEVAALGLAGGATYLIVARLVGATAVFDTLSLLRLKDEAP